MTKNLIDHVSDFSIKSRVPVLRPGYTVKISQKIKEGGKERIQIFQGLIIRVNAGHGVSKTFTVRKMVDGVGVEKIFPIYSPLIEKIEVVKEGKVRQSKLYYMRSLSGKSTRLREKDLETLEMMGAEPQAEAKTKTEAELEPEAAENEPEVNEEPVAAEEPTPEEK